MEKDRNLIWKEVRLPLLAISLYCAWRYLERAYHLPHPPVGLYIAVLAFLACVLTIWPPIIAWSRVGWLIVFGVFLVTEITTLYRQRADDQETDRNKRQQENDRFVGLIKRQQDNFGVVLSRNQQQFESTVKRFDTVLAKTQEAVSVTTGGDTFPFAMPHMNPMPDGKYEIGFWLQEQGRYPLYRLSVAIGRAYRSRSDPKQLRTFGWSIKRDEFNKGSGSLLLASFPGPQESPAYYTATMTARNGQWEEIIEARAIGPAHTFHWIVYGSTSLELYGGYGFYKKLLDLAGSDFPLSARKDLIYPLDPQLLPLEPDTRAVR